MEAYPLKKKNDFDEKNGAIGINPRDVVKITQRNGLYPNKYDVIPAEPNCRIMKYVAQYANKPSDIEEFKRQWHFPKNKNMGKYEFKELYKQC